MVRKAKILLVEDDPNLGFVTKDNLEENEYDVTWAVDGEEGLNKFNSSSFDICLLDVMLPKLDGFALGARIREADPNIPILFLTAKVMPEDRVHGFELGGDDYITKPFSMKELMLRIDVFLRRTTINKSEGHVKIYQWGSANFNHSELLLSVNGEDRLLTKKEANLLLMFCQNQNLILKREDILMEIWGDDDYFLGRSLDVFISRLRKYLKDVRQVKIINYHGIGFKFQVQE